MGEKKRRAAIEIPTSTDPSPKTPPAPGGLPGATGAELTVRIVLDDALFDPERGSTLSQMIAEQAAEQLLGEMRGHIIDQARAHAVAVLQREVTATVKSMLAESIEKAIQGTDHYGNPKGDPTTLHEVIVKRAEAALRERKDRPGSGYQRGGALIEDIISAEIEQAWRRELADVVKAAQIEVRGKVAEEAGRVMVEAMNRAAGL
jgi:hypothetical protein